MAHDLVVFGEDWGGHPSSTQHLISQLLGTRRVVWVNSLGLRAPRLTLRDGRRVFRKLGDLAQRMMEPLKDEVDGKPQPDAVIAPAAVPLPGNVLAGQLNRSLVSSQVKAAMERLDIDQPVLWTSLPTALPMLGALNERAVIYYAGDDFGALHGVDHEPVVKMEAELAQKANLILAASPKIAERFSKDKTVVVPHGVDIDLFSTPQARPADLAGGAPIIGFYGNFSGWVDTDLLVFSAKAMPDCQFYFVGPVTTDVRALHELPNVRFLDIRPHHQLPAYVQHFDVAILPFRDTPQIRACNPLKLREYLASGTPVASTDFPALDPYRSLISIGKTPKDFVAAIKTALKDGRGRSLRMRAVANETWTRRAEDIANLIDLF